MAILPSDIKFKLSINSGPGNSAAQPDPNDSIGGYMSSTEIVDATLNNLFDDISGVENEGLVEDYRCYFVQNTNASLTWFDPTIWIQSEVAGGADVAIALDGTGVVDEDSASPQAERIATELTPPSGESFSSPTTKGTGLVMANIAAGQCHAIWVRRTATDSSAINNDGATLRIEGDTIS